jgi:peptidyl-prolyl cis-trans isomerase SurA
MKLAAKITLLGGLLCASVSALAATSNKPIPKPVATPIIRIDRIIAVVNNQIITQKQLDTKIIMSKRQMHLTHTPTPPAKQLRDQALKMLIMQSLQLQIAKRAGITITDNALSDAINSIAAQNNTTLTQMRSTLNTQGISYPEFRKQIKTQMLISKVQQSAVGRQISVSKQEIQGMRKQLLHSSPVKYNLADLLVALPDNPTPQNIAAARTKAKRLLAQIKSGKSFKAVVAAQSANANATSGGELGWKSAAELPEVFVNAVKNHVTNSVVGPIQAPNGFHLLKIIGKKRDHSKTGSDEQIKQMLWQRKFAENVDIWLQQLRSSAYIKIEH